MVSLRPPSRLPVVGVLVDGRTYRHLLYLLLAIPLGFLYSALFSFGFVFGLLFAAVIVGFVVLLATLLGARIAAGFERWLANRLLGTDLERYDDVPAESNGEPVTWAIETLPEALLAASVGVVGVLAALHVTNLVAYACRQMATALLGEPTGDEAGPVRESVADDGSDSPRSDDDDSSGRDDSAPFDDPFVPADAVEPDSDGGPVGDEDRP
jgi:hypothetical protein